jgi:peroxiredoxin family protein
MNFYGGVRRRHRYHAGIATRISASNGAIVTLFLVISGMCFFCDERKHLVTNSPDYDLRLRISHAALQLKDMHCRFTPNYLENGVFLR